jgi:hypothetical protein
MQIFGLSEPDYLDALCVFAFVFRAYVSGKFGCTLID